MVPPHGTVPFVGRRPERQILDGQLADAAAGGSPAIAIVGEPGIGKTRLAEHLAASAEQRGFQVLVGRGSEFEQDVPFGLAIDALDEQFGSLPAEVLARLGSEWGAELAAVFPSMARSAGTLASPLEIERFRGHYAVRAVLAQLARVRPVLLVLDDLQWADPASLELVSHLLRRGVRTTMLVLVHRSPTGMEATAFGRAVRDGGVRTLELGPLPVDDLAESIGVSPSSARARALYDESGGNPFYFTELANVPLQPDAAALATGRSDPADTAPGAVRAAIGRELSALSPVTRRFVQCAAVTGDPFDVDFTAAVADLTDEQALTALDDLVTSNIVAPTGTPGRMVFRHPIVRRAVYDGTGHGSRLGTHRRAAAE
ncbi:MAG: ATP-binding protein, partial [Pseudonocardia sp.]